MSQIPYETIIVPKIFSGNIITYRLGFFYLYYVPYIKRLGDVIVWAGGVVVVEERGGSA